MTGWFVLVLIATAAIFAAGSKAGAATETAKAREAELKSRKVASYAKGPDARSGCCRSKFLKQGLVIATLSLTACATAPSRPSVVCPPVVACDRAFQTRLADEIQHLSPGAALERAMLDYARLRHQARACQFGNETLGSRAY